MENNFFVGEVFHKRKLIKSSYPEKLVLYTEDNYNYLDLIGGKSYNTDSRQRDYVIASSLIPTDISDYSTDYLYLLNKNKIKIKIKKESTRN